MTTAPLARAQTDHAHADCPAGGPGAPCVVTGAFGPGSFRFVYTFEDHAGEHPRIVGVGRCTEASCTEVAIGTPGADGFSVDMDLFGNNATIIEAHSGL